MLNVLSATLLAPALLWTGFLRPDWRRALQWAPALAAAAITVIHGWSFEGAFALIVLTAVIVGPRPRKNRWAVAAILALAVLVVLDFDADRPRGFIFKNALTAAHALALFTILFDWPWMAAVAGFTGTRTPLMILAWDIRPSWRYFAALFAYVVGLGAWFLIHGVTDERVDVAQAAAWRGGLNAEWWQGWLGSGFGNFPGTQRPHNAFLALWAQSGVLTIPILLTAAWHARKVHPLALLPLVPSLWYSDWLFSTAGGIGMIAVYIAFAQERRPWPGYQRAAVVDKPQYQALARTLHRYLKLRILPGAVSKPPLDR